MTLQRLWAGWREQYVSDPATGSDDNGCVICRLADADDDEAALVIARTSLSFAVMNLYPYGSGHVMVAPLRHEAALEDLDDAEAADLMAVLRDALRAIKVAYGAEGANVGANLGRAAGAGVPSHVHMHAVPRWSGDTNFMTSIAEARVIPEDPHTGWQKLRNAWPVR